MPKIVRYRDSGGRAVLARTSMTPPTRVYLDCENRIDQGRPGSDMGRYDGIPECCCHYASYPE